MISPGFTREEYNALISLLDAGVKHLGLQAATPAAVLLQKLNAADKAAREAEASNVVEMKRAE